MTSTATQNILLEKQSATDNPGTWGDRLNTALDMIDSAISGITNVLTTGGTVTLSDASYTNDDAKSLALVVSGSLSSDAEIVVPSRNKLYVVNNATSGFFDVRIKTATSSALSVTQGKVGLVFVDGDSDTVSSIGDASWGNISGTLSDQADLQAALNAKLDDSQASAFGLSVLGSADASAARTLLGLVIGSNVQAFDATLQSLSSLGTAADKYPYTTAIDTWTEGTITSFGRSLIDDADATAARTTLGLGTAATQPSSAFQPSDTELTALAGLTSAADALPYFTGSGTAAVTTLSAYGRTLIDDADALAARSTLGLVIGTNVQAQDTELSALAGLTSAADQVPYFTGSGTAALMTVTSAARTVLDDTSVGAMLTTLGGQPVDAELSALAGLTSAADQAPYFTGAGTAALMTVTSAARTVLDDTSTVNMLTTLGGQPVDATLTALAAYNTNGLITQTAADTFAGRTITQPAAGITITNGNGVAGNPTLALANDLSALEGLAGTGLAARTGSDTWAQRSITQPAAGITVTNGDGAAGNPTLALANDLAAVEGLATTGLVRRTGVDTWSAGTTISTAEITDDAVTYAKMQNIATDRLLGRDTAATGDVEEISVGGGLEFSGTGGIQRSALTGDVTAMAGSGATTIANDVVTYAKIQNVSATDKVLGRSTAGAGDVEEIACTSSGRAMIAAASAAAQTALLSAVVGDSGSGGTKGLVPAPATGDATKFLKGDGTWTAIPGGGDALTSNPLSQFAATTSAELRGVLSDETGTGFAYFQGGDLGTPSAGVLTNATGLPVGTGISGLGTNVATFLATPSSANLAAAVTDETGFNTGAKAVFSAGPTLDAGTTTIPALTFTSGTNLTTATAGAWEYNGSVPFFTPSGTQRGLVPAFQFFRLNANLAGTNGTGTQNVFGKSATVSSSTVYRFNAFITLNKTAGTTSHTVTFSIGGTASLNTSNWGGMMTSNASDFATALVRVGRSTSNSLTATSAITTATWNITLQVFGTISVATGGTFNLNYALSAAPGGAYSTIIGSCIELWPVGATGADINWGTWA